MKSITPAYSVIALFQIILIGITLVGYPSSVFSQSDGSTITEISQSEVDTDSNDTDQVESAVNSVGVQDSVPSEVQAGIPSIYKIDKLMSDRVYSDFVVGPGRFSLEIAPGQTKMVEIVVTNRMGIPKTFSLTTEDMSGTDDPSSALTLLGDAVGPYSIKDFISVPQKQFVLQHAERVKIPVTVSIPADAEPGGFYGSLLTQIVSDDVDRPDTEGAVPGSKMVSRIGTLFFVTTPGDIDHSSELKDFATLQHKKFYTKGPIDFNVVTENKGTVHVTPFGEMRIFNTLGNEVGYVELQPWYVLPQSIRNKEIAWNREFLVGRYTAVVEINRGYDGIIDEAKYTFWVIPLELIAAIFAGFFVVFLILRFFFSRFEFKRKGS